MLSFFSVARRAHAFYQSGCFSVFYDESISQGRRKRVLILQCVYLYLTKNINGKTGSSSVQTTNKFVNSSTRCRSMKPEFPYRRSQPSVLGPEGHYCSAILSLTADEDLQHTTTHFPCISIFFYNLKHVEFCAYELRLIFCHHLKKTAAESRRMLVEAYGQHALGKHSVSRGSIN